MTRTTGAGITLSCTFDDVECKVIVVKFTGGILPICKATVLYGTATCTVHTIDEF